MQRRRFFKLAGSSAVSLAGLGIERRLNAQQLSPSYQPPPELPPSRGPLTPYTIWDTSAAAAATVVPQGTYVTPNGAAWATLSSALAGLYASLQANPAFDQQFMAAARSVSVSSLTSANIDQAALLADLQTTTPQLTAADLQNRLRFIDTLTADQKQSVLDQAASSGLSPFVYNFMASTASLANLITPGSANSVPHCMFTQPNPPPPGGGDPITGGGGCGGGGGQPPSSPPPPSQKQLWCDGAGLILLAAAVAFLAIDFLSDGTAAPLNAPLWKGVAKWAGRGTVAGSTGPFLAGCF